MSLIVVGYPKVSPEDLRRIQGIRAEHGRLYHRFISKHFALVFPAADADPGRLVQHVEERTEESRRIPFLPEHASVVDDDFRDLRHTFLVPDEVYGDFVKLLDARYRGL